MTTIARPSVASLLLVPRAKENEFSTGTGFLVEHQSAVYLITNWHVLAGRNPQTGNNMHSSGAWPDDVVIIHNEAGHLGRWLSKIEPVRDVAGPLWLEHPTFGRKVDVVALLLTDTSNIDVYAHDAQGGNVNVASGVTRGVSIVGFPFGMTGGGAFGIWVQGTVATEPAIDFNDLPCFLVDSRTRPGQSGSPVLFYADGGMVPMADGSTAVMGGPVEKLLGIYSGRINDQSDLGIVWKASVITQIIEAGQRGTD